MMGGGGTIAHAGGGALKAIGIGGGRTVAAPELPELVGEGPGEGGGPWGTGFQGLQGG